MSFGSPEEVKLEIKYRMKTMGNEVDFFWLLPTYWNQRFDGKMFLHFSKR